LTDGIVDYAVLVSSKNPVKRISAALGALDVADGPMSRLEAARRLREAAEELEAAQVEAARKAGATWIEIGACYGLTKQGAQQRFRAARNQAKAAAAAPGSKKDEPPA
jgi:ATPase subunit of ABC transporter with duplicated ATPase domains